MLISILSTILYQATETSRNVTQVKFKGLVVSNNQNMNQFLSRIIHIFSHVYNIDIILWILSRCIRSHAADWEFFWLVLTTSPLNLTCVTFLEVSVA